MFPITSPTYDPLTRLLDRAALIAYLAHDIEQAERKRTQVTLLLVTLDGLSRAYAALGQADGDQLLGDAADRLRKAVRSGDRVARWDETTFAVLLLDARGGAHVTAVAWRVRLACTTETRRDTDDVRLQARVGYARYPDDGVLPEALVAHATAALEAGSEEHLAHPWTADNTASTQPDAGGLRRRRGDIEQQQG